MANPTLFVSIICFKDPDVVNTVRDLLQTAANPEQITIGIVLQEDEADLHLYEPLKSIKNVKLSTFPIEWAEGCGKARFEAVKLYEGQNYFFQTDSHMRFDPRWDEMLIKELKQCPADKPILTTLPPGFDPITGVKEPPAFNKLILKSFFRHLPLHVGKRTSIEDYVPTDKPLPTPFLAGGVMFTTGIICGIKPDPFFYFHGEEFTMNLRLWTRGYTNFSPRFNFCYHEYRHPNIKRVTLKDINPNKDQYFYERSMSRYQVLLNFREKHEVPQDHLIDLNRYGLGTFRTVRDWENTYKIWIREEKAEPEAFA